MGNNAETCLLDFESRSACSLKKCGAHKYSIDASTEILCLAFRLPHWTKSRVELWTPEFPHLDMPEANPDGLSDLLEWIDAGALVEAHNFSFESFMWASIMVPRYGWPAIQPGQGRCSAAKAAAHALPRSLEDAGAALNLAERKDTEGHKLMMKLAKPRKSRKKEREAWDRAGVPHPAILYHESREQFERLGQYCKQDILAEEALSNALADLSPAEQEIYSLDQTINARGFLLDTEAVSTALTLIASETKKLNAELAVVTGGVVKKATQRAQMMAWFNENGLELFDTQKETLDEVVKRDDLTAPARRGLEIVRTLGRSSTAKYQRMEDWIDPSDGRVRGGLLYHGATTGRWSGSGVQPHNFPKGGLKDPTDPKGKRPADLNAVWDALKAHDNVTIERDYGGVMEALSGALRGAIVAAPGKQLYVADYAAIEARVVLWLAQDDESLDIFRQNRDIYLEMAESIYGYPCNLKDHVAERTLSKIAVLGLSYQMGASKFAATCEKYGVVIDEAFAQRVVSTYRDRFYKVKQLWTDQEEAAIAAVQSNRPVQCGYMRWLVEGPFLFCELPSGRRLAYPYPEIRARATPWGAMKSSLTFKGVDSYTRKWRRQVTYGGCLVENGCQSVARDLMASAMLRCEQSGKYPIVLTIHDELVAESPDGVGSVHEFEQMVAEVPDWAEGCPVMAAGWVGRRYKK